MVNIKILSNPTVFNIVSNAYWPNQHIRMILIDNVTEDWSNVRLKFCAFATYWSLKVLYYTIIFCSMQDICWSFVFIQFIELQKPSTPSTTTCFFPAELTLLFCPSFLSVLLSSPPPSLINLPVSLSLSLTQRQISKARVQRSIIQRAQDRQPYGHMSPLPLSTHTVLIKQT